MNPNPQSEHEPLGCPHGRLPMNGEDGWKHCPHCLGINNTNPQSEVKCCELCGKPKPHPLPHPKESPVSQSVEGWEREFDSFLLSKEMHSLICGHANGEGKWEIIVRRIKQNFISPTLSTLVKEMEGEKWSYKQGHDFANEAIEIGTGAIRYVGNGAEEATRLHNAGISAAVEVVKKMI